MRTVIRWTFSRTIDLFLSATDWLAVKFSGRYWDWPTHVVERIPESWTDHSDVPKDLLYKQVLEEWNDLK